MMGDSVSGLLMVAESLETSCPEAIVFASDAAAAPPRLSSSGSVHTAMACSSTVESTVSRGLFSDVLVSTAQRGGKESVGAGTDKR